MAVCRTDLRESQHMRAMPWSNGHQARCHIRPQELVLGRGGLSWSPLDLVIASASPVGGGVDERFMVSWEGGEQESQASVFSNFGTSAFPVIIASCKLMRLNFCLPGLKSSSLSHFHSPSYNFLRQLKIILLVRCVYSPECVQP